MDMGSLRDIFVLLQKQRANTLKCEPFIPEIIISQITFQILNGIAYLHNNCNQVHRDIKLENILVNYHGQVKLSDFVFHFIKGISKELKKNNSVCNTFIGTMTYMYILKTRSPERI
jgi:serine/threonine protein kinase